MTDVVINNLRSSCVCHHSGPISFTSQWLCRTHTVCCYTTKSDTLRYIHTYDFIFSQTTVSTSSQHKRSISNFFLSVDWQKLTSKINCTHTDRRSVEIADILVTVYLSAQIVFDRSYAITRLKNSNLLLLMVDSVDMCAEPCLHSTRLPFQPVENILWISLFWIILRIWGFSRGCRW